MLLLQVICSNLSLSFYVMSNYLYIFNSLIYGRVGNGIVIYNKIQA